MRAPRVLILATILGLAGTIAAAPSLADAATHGRSGSTHRSTPKVVRRAVTFPVQKLGDTYTGEVTISQHDFGIEPIRIAGGAVKVKDQLKIAFEIAPSP